MDEARAAGEVPMEFRAEGLAFSLQVTPPDCEGWMWCHAVVEAPHFHGGLDFFMLRYDLEAFRDALSNALDDARWPCEVRLESTEPGVELWFRVERTGRVAGGYRFGDVAEFQSMLSGKLTMDQTYLGPWLKQVRRALVEPPQGPP